MVSLVVCCQLDPLQVSESSHYHIWEVCLTNWWDALKCKCLQLSLVSLERLSFSPWQIPMSPHKTNTSKLNKLSYKFCLICYTHLPSRNLPLLQASQHLFTAREYFQSQQRQQMFCKSLSNPKAQILYYRNEQTYFSLAKMYWLELFLFWLVKILSLVILI